MSNPDLTHGEKIPIEEHHLEGGVQPARLLTTASDQDPEVAPKVQIAALTATFAAAVYWTAQLYTITVFAAFSRNIVAVLGESSKQAWVLNSFNVVTIVCVPIFSYFSDIYGRKWFMVVPPIFAVIGGAIGATAHSMNMVLLACAFVGVGGSCFGVCTAIPSEVLPHRYRSLGAAFVFTTSAAAPFAALLGISHSISVDPVNGWRWIFRSIIICYGVNVFLWIFAYRPPPRQTEYTENKPSLDYVGYLLIMAATVPFLIGLTWGGSTYPWKSAHVLAPLIIGIAMFFVFGAWEWKGRKDGILHHDLFKNRNFPLTIIAILIEGYVYLGFSSLYPQEVATVYEHDLFKSSTYALPFYGAFILTLPLGGLYVAKTRDQITPIIVGFALFTGALIGFACSKPDKLGLFIGMDVLAGLGFSQPLTFLTVVAQFAAPAGLMGTSTAVVLTVRTLGGSIGSAVVTTIANSKINAKLPAYVAAATLPLGLNPQQLGLVIGAATGDETLIGEIAQGHIPGVTMQIFGAAAAAASQAFSDSYKYCWIALIPLSAVGCLSICLLKRNRQQLDYIVDAPLEHIHHKH